MYPDPEGMDPWALLPWWACCWARALGPVLWAMADMERPAPPRPAPPAPAVARDMVDYLFICLEGAIDAGWSLGWLLG